MTAPECPPTPECEKLRGLRDEITAIRRFLEYLDSRGIVLASLDPYLREYYPASDGHQDLIYRHLGVNARALEEERQALLDWQASLNPTAA